MLLTRIGKDDTVFVAEKHAVQKKWMTGADLATVLEAYQDACVTDPLVSRRSQRAAIVPLQSVVDACRHHGYHPGTCALLQALDQLPDLWKAKLEAAANAARGEEDLVLTDTIEALEDEQVHLAAELVSSYVPYAETEADEDQARSWTLTRISPALERDLQAFAKYRADPLNRLRDGSAVVDVTVGGDIATCKRFLGYLQAEHEVPPGLGVFGQPELGEWVEAYLRALQAKGLRWSSMANYTNSILTFATYYNNTYEGYDCVEDLARLRGQCESQAKVQGANRARRTTTPTPTHTRPTPAQASTRAGTRCSSSSRTPSVRASRRRRSTAPSRQESATPRARWRYAIGASSASSRCCRRIARPSCAGSAWARR